MLDTKDYTKMTLEELLEEEKKMKSQKIITALLIGFLIGIAVYSVVNKGLILPIILLIIASVLGRRSSQAMRDLQTQINLRKNGQ